jgi:predicted transcriptional regulator
MAGDRSGSTTAVGLAGLRRRGAITELLFLFECTTEETTQLRPIADRLDLTVQAASHVYRQLAARGLAEIQNGRYRPTQVGVAWLHAALGLVRDDVGDRLDRLHIIRSTRALALSPIAANAEVALELRDGMLTARPGRGSASRGRARHPARAGEILEVDGLEGIVSISRGRVTVLTVPMRSVADRRTLGRLRTAVQSGGPGLLAAHGLDAFHLLERATSRPVVRFGISSACREASHVGVDSLVLVLEEELPRFLGPFEGNDPPPLTVAALS